MAVHCKGARFCERDNRTIACRGFPFYPYLTRERQFIGIGTYWVFEDRCWMMSNIEIVDREFVDQFNERFHRNRREHGGEIDRLDPDQLDRLTEEERVEAGVDDYDPDEVPPATDTPPLTDDVRQTEVYQEERAEFRREYEKGELHPIDEDHPFPPTRYDD